MDEKLFLTLTKKNDLKPPMGHKKNPSSSWIFSFEKSGLAIWDWKSLL
jgi:hypothetical protein